VLGVDLRVLEDLTRIPVRELEQLVQHTRLRIVHARRRRNEQRECTRRRRQRVRGGGTRHGKARLRTGVCAR
jgi:hypothetical protein